MHTGQPVCQIILRQHDFLNSCKIFRFFIFYPQNLGRRKSGKGNVRRIFGKLILTDYIVQIIAFFIGSAVIPQKSGTDNLIVFIQKHQPVHLSAEADAGYLFLFFILKQFLQSVHRLYVPVLRLLLRPAGMREIQGVFPGNRLLDFTIFVHQ